MGSSICLAIEAPAQEPQNVPAAARSLSGRRSVLEAVACE
jgi:hypothetical protein